MSSIYDIADIAVRINVGYKGLDKVVKLKYTKLALNLSTLLYKQGLITSFKITTEGIFLTLKYTNSKPLINVIKVISKPGKRVYWTIQRLALNYNANSIAGIYILSTPLGLITSTECLLSKNITGEVLLKITLY